MRFKDYLSILKFILKTNALAQMAAISFLSRVFSGIKRFSEQLEIAPNFYN
jgi:hypothetical protein